MFDEILCRIVDETKGGIGAVLMGYDGIAVEQYFLPREEFDLQLVAVEYANILKEVRKTAEILRSGETEEVSIRTEKFYVIIRTVGDEYFVVMTLERDGNYGKARYLLTREVPQLILALA